MKQTMKRRVQVPLLMEQSLKDRLTAESNRQNVARNTLIRDWLTEKVTTAEKGRGITWTPAAPPPESETFTQSTMGDQTPPFVDGRSMSSQPPAQAGPGLVPPTPTLTDNPGPQPQQETTTDETPTE